MFGQLRIDHEYVHNNNRNEPRKAVEVSGRKIIEDQVRPARIQSPRNLVEDAVLIILKIHYGALNPIWLEDIP